VCRVFIPPRQLKLKSARLKQVEGERNKLRDGRAEFDATVGQLRDALEKRAAALKKVSREKTEAEQEAQRWQQVRVSREALHRQLLVVHCMLRAGCCALSLHRTAASPVANPSSSSFLVCKQCTCCANSHMCTWVGCE
jgi:hypothetical protein